MVFNAPANTLQMTFRCGYKQHRGSGLVIVDVTRFPSALGREYVAQRICRYRRSPFEWYDPGECKVFCESELGKRAYVGLLDLLLEASIEPAHELSNIFGDQTRGQTARPLREACLPNAVTRVPQGGPFL